jgi:hypothetical protein
VSKDVKFDEDAWFSKSLEPSIGIEEGENIGVPKADLKVEEKSDSDQQGHSEGIDASLPSSPAKKSRWFT